jgi:hypothetical protein
MGKAEREVEFGEHAGKGNGMEREKPVWPTFATRNETWTQKTVLDRALDKPLGNTGEVGDLTRRQISSTHNSSPLRDEFSASLALMQLESDFRLEAAFTLRWNQRLTTALVFTRHQSAMSCAASTLLELSRLGQVDAEAVAPALVAARHLGRAVPELLLDVPLTRLRCCGEPGPEQVSRKPQPPLALG